MQIVKNILKKVTKKLLPQVIKYFSLKLYFLMKEILNLIVDIVKVDALLVRKNPKRHFFRDIGNSFHEVTHIGLEPHQIFSF